MAFTAIGSHRHSVERASLTMQVALWDARQRQRPAAVLWPGTPTGGITAPLAPQPDGVAITVGTKGGEVRSHTSVMLSIVAPLRTCQQLFQSLCNAAGQLLAPVDLQADTNRLLLLLMQRCLPVQASAVDSSAIETQM